MEVLKIVLLLLVSFQSIGAIPARSHLVKRQFYQNIQPEANQIRINCVSPDGSCTLENVENKSRLKNPEEFEATRAKTIVTGDEALKRKTCNCHSPTDRQFYQVYADPNDICNCNNTSQQFSHADAPAPAQTVPIQANPVQQASSPVQGLPVVQAAPVQAPVVAFVPSQSVTNPTDVLASYYSLVPYQYQLPFQQQQLAYLGYPGLPYYWPMAAHSLGYLGRKKRTVTAQQL